MSLNPISFLRAHFEQINEEIRPYWIPKKVYERLSPKMQERIAKRYEQYQQDRDKLIKIFKDDLGKKQNSPYLHIKKQYDLMFKESITSENYSKHAKFLIKLFDRNTRLEKQKNEYLNKTYNTVKDFYNL